MKIKPFAKEWLFGSGISNEYVCLAQPAVSDPFQVVMCYGSERLDVTRCHVLLGYRPVLLGIYGINNVALPKNITLQFCRHAGEVIATLEMKIAHTHPVGEDNLCIFEGVHGEHAFLNWFHRSMNAIAQAIKRQKAGNVGLPGNLYDQVRIAYSVPRTVSVIALGEAQRYNFFPTDLHGSVGEQFYVGSLRHEGMASQQVESFGKIALSEVEATAYKCVYGLGKNHMRDLRAASDFEISRTRTLRWDLPLLASTISYRELQLIDSLDVGIHRIHFYSVEHRVVLKDAPPLKHIHQYYAQWRSNNGLATDLLIR